MKICFLTHNVRHDNGGGVFSARLIEGAQATGAEVVALTTLSAGKPYERQLLPTGRLTLIRNLLAVRAELKAADIVHALDTYPYGVVACVAGLGLKKKIIITAVGTGAIAGLYRFPQSLVMRFAYARATIITAISTFTCSEIHKRLPGVPIRVITPGVDYERFAAPASALTLASSRRPYLLSVGSLRWRKGYHYSIQAFAKIQRELPDLNYIIVGKRYTQIEYERLHALIQELGLEGSVEILEHVDDEEELRALYQGAEAFCLLSQNDDHDVEGFGLVFLEAAAAGLPVVGSLECGAEDAVDNGVNGVLVSPKDSDACARAVVAILRTPGSRESMSAASKAFARKNDWSRKLPLYFGLYE